MKDKVLYNFKIGTRFIIDVLPVNNGDVVFSCTNQADKPSIEIGVLEKTGEDIIQSMKLESLLDDIPDGKFRIMLEKMEVSE
ncbi:MAG: hypothetical protein LBP37_04050 [Spirochaetaceae bacterium]|nr:hypothetical protein [Spirochaetaceae bacterium]